MSRPRLVDGVPREMILQVARRRFETPTNKQLAKEAGCSVQTVQRIVSEELRRLRGGRR